MAGYAIHLAIGEEYIKRYKDEIKNKEEFLTGIIEPDNTNDKLKSHYGYKKSKKSLINFIDTNKEKIDEDFEKGYFLHLYTDYIFYSKYFSNICLYDDYSKTNQYIIEKYNVKIPEVAKKYAQYTNGEPEFLKYELLDKIINEITDKKIKDIINSLEGDRYEY